MANNSNIAKTGWLYEGNYNEWQKRMDAIRQLTVLHDPGAKRMLDNQRQCFLITTNISPFFLARIPDICRSNNFRLQHAVQRHARTFPLLKLPAEIRLQIYGHFFVHHDKCMKGWDGDLGLVVTEEGMLDMQAVFSILAVSKEIRCEALPVFISHSTFYVDFSTVTNGKLGPLMCRWTKNGLKSGVRFLQNVRVALSYEPEPESEADESFEGFVDISFTPWEGLRCNSYSDVGKPWLPLLKAHLEDVEESRKALNLQGEAIVMALTTRPELWKMCHEYYFAED
ncbi:hypothetical protein LTR17_004728 [Elasticomyces elasticus]|nr:hypothetical protein LTR17_004728 [Elasticomyces elasticus]